MDTCNTQAIAIVIYIDDTVIDLINLWVGLTVTIMSLTISWAI